MEQEGRRALSKGLDKRDGQDPGTYSHGHDVGRGKRTRQDEQADA